MSGRAQSLGCGEADEGCAKGVVKNRPRLDLLTITSRAGKLGRKLTHDTIEFIPPHLPCDLKGHTVRDGGISLGTTHDRLIGLELRSFRLLRHSPETADLPVSDRVPLHVLYVKDQRIFERPFLAGLYIDVADVRRYKG